MRLNRKVQIWQEHELISEKQAEKILDFERQNSVNGHWLTILFCFAAFLVGLGIVAMVAANWQEIPNIIKLVGALALLSASGIAVLWANGRGFKIAFAALMCLHCILIMAVIGVTGQVFQLRSDVEGAFLLWSILTFPLLFTMPGLIWGWLPIFYWVAVEKLHDYTLVGRDVLGLWILLLIIVLYEVLVNLPKYKSHMVVRALRWFSGIFMLGFYGKRDDIRLNVESDNILIVTLGLICVTTILVYFINQKYQRKSFMPLFLMGLAIVSFCPIMVVPTLYFCGVMALYAYKHQSPRLFNGAVLLAVLRVLSYYMNGNDLLFMGVKLIVSGIVLALTLWGLKKYGKLLWKGTL